ncbi:MAG: PqqD family protein [Tannerellaceae bacterium]|jgi:hypothetical protein|nr:PqqD family protein [Tannerellaceae bacterium]
MDRRDFLFRLGLGTTLSIAGVFTVDDALPAGFTGSQELPEPPSGFPELSKDVAKRFEDDKLILSGGRTNCYVNKTGGKVIEWMDGKNSLQAISSHISEYYSVEHTDTLESSVAMFICQLGEAGLLASPFYVTMYETT